MAAVAITRTELTAAQLRRAATRTQDANAARRMLALALVMEGKSRSEAAAACGMDRQTLATGCTATMPRVWRGRVGRQFEQADVVRDVQFAAGLMPAGAVEQNDGVAVGRDDAADLGEVQVHRLGVGLGQDERSADIPRGTDRAEQIGPVVALIARRARPAAALGPNAG